MTALACASHLLVDLPLFGGPVLFVVGAVLLIRRSDRRRFAEGGAQGADDGALVGRRDRPAMLQG